MFSISSFCSSDHYSSQVIEGNKYFVKASDIGCLSHKAAFLLNSCENKRLHCHTEDDKNTLNLTYMVVAFINLKLNIKNQTGHEM